MLGRMISSYPDQAFRDGYQTSAYPNNGGHMTLNCHRPTKTDNHLDFFGFIAERAHITSKKEAGVHWPWTMDWVLQNTRITNLDRAHDRGTIRLCEKIRHMQDANRINTIVLYRSGYSAPRLLENLSGDTLTDTRWLEKSDGKFVDRLPYQVLMHDGEHIHEFMIKSCFDVATYILRRLPCWKKASLEDVAREIADSFVDTHGFKMIFLGTEIAKDLSYFYPDSIDRESVCPFNKGAKKGLAQVYEDGLPPGLYSLKKRKAYLRQRTGFSWEKLEHSLCEYAKYVERFKYLMDNPDRTPWQWLYVQNPDPLYMLKDGLSA